MDLKGELNGHMRIEIRKICWFTVLLVEKATLHFNRISGKNLIIFYETTIVLS